MASEEVMHLQADKNHVPIGIPLSGPLFDEQGMVLLRAGTVIASEEDRDFLLDHFRLYTGSLTSDASERSGEKTSESLTLAEMQLPIGAPLGVRSTLATSGAMQPSRLIGVSPNQSLFATPPGAGRQPTPLGDGENVQIVAIGAHSVFSFVCTVQAVCRHPFEYLVFSEPGAIRLLRERKAVRVRTRLAVEYARHPYADTYEGLGMGRDLSMQGMSLIAPQRIGSPGTGIRVSFAVKTQDVDVQLTTRAVIRNVREAGGPSNPVTHGIEFDELGADQLFVLRAFVFDRMTSYSR